MRVCWTFEASLNSSIDKDVKLDDAHLLIDINWHFFVTENIFAVKSGANGRSIFSVLCTSDKWVGSMLGRLVVTAN